MRNFVFYPVLLLTRLWRLAPLCFEERLPWGELRRAMEPNCLRVMTYSGTQIFTDAATEKDFFEP